MRPAPVSQVQLCGDAHLSNFGAFAAPDRRLVFSINDFDETLPGPFEWDVKRLVASFAVAGRDRGFSANAARCDQRSPCARRTAKRWRASPGCSNLDLWYARIEVGRSSTSSPAGSAKQMKRLERNVEKARSKDSLKAFAKLTEIVDGEPRIITDPPVIVPIEELFATAELTALDDPFRVVVRSYRRTLTADRRRLLERFRYAHAARKVVGVGSVGTRAWIMLLLGRDGETRCSCSSRRPKPRCSNRSSARASSPTTANGSSRASGLHRQRATSCSAGSRTDREGGEGDFYVRQLWDAKGSALVE